MVRQPLESIALRARAHEDIPQRNATGSGRPPRDAGFTFMELVTAVAVLAVVSIATLLTLIPVSRQTRVNRELAAAAAAARNVLEEMQATPFADLVTVYPDGQVIPVGTLDDGQVAIAYEDPAADPLQIQVSLSWVSPEVGPMTRTYVTMRTE